MITIQYIVVTEVGTIEIDVMSEEQVLGTIEIDVMIEEHMLGMIEIDVMIEELRLGTIEIDVRVTKDRPKEDDIGNSSSIVRYSHIRKRDADNISIIV